MRKAKHLTILLTAAILVLVCGIFAACDPYGDTSLPIEGNTDVVKAFNAISPAGDLVTQTAILADNRYVVTVITTEYATEYILGKDFAVVNSTNIKGEAPAAMTAATGQSALEQAYAKALELSELDAKSVTGFDFDKDTYMGKAVYKVEIEEVGAKYEYVFDAETFELIGSDIEFENDLPTGSYISENTAYRLALRAAGVSADVSATAVIRCEFEDGKKLYKISFDYAAFRYDVSIDAVGGGVVKFSKSAQNVSAPEYFENISAEQAKSIALAFVFGDEQQTGYAFRKVKLDRDDGQFVYEIEVTAKGAEYEFEIAAQGGTILDVEIDNVAEQSKPLPSDRQFVSREDAINAVKRAAGEGVYIIEVEIDKEGGKYYYEIEARVNGVEREYLVDALTGEILNTSAPTGGAILEDDAVAIAMKAFDIAAYDRKIVKLEREDGVLCFKVKLYVGNVEYEAEIDATTGAVLKKETDVEGGYIPPATGGNMLTAEQAKAALKQIVGESAIIRDAELEYENGKYVYEIEVLIDGREYDYFVDAATGVVTKNEDFVSGGEAVIGEEQALSVALREFGVDAGMASVRKVKLERENGRLCYDVEFFVNNVKYEA